MKLICKILILLLFHSLITQGQEFDSSYVLDTPEKAYEQAIAYTGFDSVKYSFKDLSDNDNIKLVDMNNDKLFHLPEDTTNINKIWEIRFDSVRLEFGCRWVPSVIEEQKIKHYTVYMDAETGVLREIRGQVDTLQIFFFDTYSEDEVYNFESYSGFSNLIPQITFRKALDLAVPSNPPMADEIQALLVNVNDRGKEKDIWCITGKGIPYSHFFRGTIVRTYVDAISGKMIKSSTFFLAILPAVPL